MCHLIMEEQYETHIIWHKGECVIFILDKDHFCGPFLVWLFSLQEVSINAD